MFFFFSSRRRHTRFDCDWSSDVCSSDLASSSKSALDELKEDAVLPHPVRLRDMILRTQLNAGDALEMNREFQNYLSHYGETQKVALEILEKIAASVPENS